MLKGKELSCKGLVHGWGVASVYQRPPHQSASPPDPGSLQKTVGLLSTAPLLLCSEPCVLSREEWGGDRAKIGKHYGGVGSHKEKKRPNRALSGAHFGQS